MIFFNEIKKYGRTYYPAILLDELISFRKRNIIKAVMFIIMAILFIIMVLIPYATTEIAKAIFSQHTLNYFISNIFRIRGLFLLISIVWIKMYWIEVFYLSHYFRKAKVDYEVAKLSYLADEEDVTKSFLKSRIGKYIISKLGIEYKNVKSFLASAERVAVQDSDLKFRFNARNSELDDPEVINLPDYLKSIFDADKSFQNFLKRHAISEDEFFGAVEWVQSIYWKARNNKRFWSRENLIRIPSVGRLWYFDNMDYLNIYASLIYESKTYNSLGNDWRIFEEEARKLENFLLDQKLNNVLLISDRLSTSMQVASAFAKTIVIGNCVSKFENKKMYVLKVDSLIHGTNSPEEIKNNLHFLVSQIEKNDDVILVIPNLVEFIEKLMNVDLDSTTALKQILNDKKISIVALTSKADYFSVIEPDYELAKHFDKQEIPKIDKKFVLRILQDEAHKIEIEDGINVIFPVINRLAEKHLIEVNPVKSALKELYQIYSETN